MGSCIQEVKKGNCATTLKRKKPGGSNKYRATISIKYKTFVDKSPDSCGLIIQYLPMNE